MSEITEFFAECNVLVTGCTGFVGQLLVEKLLRSCSNIRKLYLIVRAKKEKSSEERYKQLFEDKLYDRLKRESPDFLSKVVMIDGEFNQSGLSISAENRELIKDSHIVFHGAATVRFDDKLRFAVNINVRGTKEIILLCTQMPNLKAVVYVGTAFSHCIHKCIDEVFYEPLMDYEKLFTLLDTFDDEQLGSLTPTLIGKYPNTYAFTKATAENVVQNYCEKLPICIVRPSIMVGTEKEPVPGWINNIYGVTGIAVGAGVGLLHSVHGNGDYVADIIPADYVINNIIAAAWDIGKSWTGSMQSMPISQASEEKNMEKKPPIYNSVTSIQNPITWNSCMELSKMHHLEMPLHESVWYCFITVNKYLWIHNIHIFALHIIPAAIVDTLARLTGREPKLMNTYKKIHKFMGVITYFCTQQWTFRNDNVMKLWDKMSPIDKKIFYFNVSEFEWTEYFRVHVRGIRVFLFKESLETVEQAKKRYTKLKILHYTTMTVMSLLLIWLGYVILSVLYSLILS